MSKHNKFAIGVGIYREGPSQLSQSSAEAFSGYVQGL